MKVIVLSLFLILASAVFAQDSNVLGGSSRLVDPYGICAHISMSDADFRLRDKEMRLAEELGVNFVRSDFLYEQVMNKEEKANFARFDSAIAAASRHNISFLPILARNTRRGYAWENKAGYLKYVESLVSYFPAIKYWEIINEADLIAKQGTKRELAQKYMDVLPEVGSVIRHNDRTAVLGGVSSLDKDFFAPIVKDGALDHCDVMNFHLYTNYNSPEVALRQYSLLRDTLDRYSAHCPVWLTETGYHTESGKNVARQFAVDVLGELMEREGIVKGSVIGVVSDDDWGFHKVSEQLVDELEQMGYNVRWLSLAELKDITPDDVKMLVPTQGEMFPMAFFDDIEAYVRRGGTLFLSQGIPFYYDYTREGKNKGAGAEYRTRLHMATDLPWTDASKKKGVPFKPTKFGSTRNVKSLYSWQPEGEQSTRYMSSDALRRSDRLVSAVDAGSDTYTGSVAGVYELRSDLKGNIIFNTSWNRYGNVSESLQAKRLTRSFLLAFASGVEKVFWYNLRAMEGKNDDMEHHFGIVHHDLSPKPAFYAYKTLIRMLPSQSTRPVMTVDRQRDVYTCEWTRPDGKRVFAAWTTAHTTSISLPRRFQRGRITDYLGNDRGKSSRFLVISNGVTFVVAR